MILTFVLIEIRRAPALLHWRRWKLSLDHALLCECTKDPICWRYYFSSVFGNEGVKFYTWKRKFLCMLEFVMLPLLHQQRKKGIFKLCSKKLPVLSFIFEREEPPRPRGWWTVFAFSTKNTGFHFITQKHLQLTATVQKREIDPFFCRKCSATLI